MQRLIIVSNRLPVSVEKRAGELSFKGSVGGVATGLGSFHETHESVWVGWADVPARCSADDREMVRGRLRDEFQCSPVFLSPSEVKGFYHDFSNRTLWPLFHSFTQYVEYDAKAWRDYERVNRKYCDAVLEVARPGDTIWVQDYQLMLLPQMLREALPEASIGFFLHIPFPAFEVFRMLPWRREIAEGLLGADLIGFHTYDYVRHFLAAALKLTGVEDYFGRLTVDDRLVLVDAFPMGIDFDRYADGGASKKVLREAERIKSGLLDRRIILSMDRLDYSKGIPERLRAFSLFLERHPEWRGKVSLIAVAVPSRTRVDTYRQLKDEVDRIVGEINGKYSTIDWTPVRYLYRSLPFTTLLGMYAAADVALVTPLRDGMNLIAKEYVAARSGRGGVLVLSEMAGAARELGEAVLVNPFDIDGVVDAIASALTMDTAEQQRRSEAMVLRLSRYTVQRWAEDFLGSLAEIKLVQVGLGAHPLDEPGRERLLDSYRSAGRRLLLLDYDGTLVPFSADLRKPAPDAALKDTLATLSANPRNRLVLMSGRSRAILDEWFGDLEIDLIAEHGVWLRENSGEWRTIEPMTAEWKDRVRTIIEMLVDRTPGSLIEEKEFSLVWHNRAVHQHLAETRAEELREALVNVVADYGLRIVEGDKAIEVMAAGITRGRAAHMWMSSDEYDFQLVVGGDRMDEEVFEASPETAWTIKVGAGSTRAMYSVRSVKPVRRLLCELTEHAGKERE